MADIPAATRLDTLYLWYLGNPASPQGVGELRLLTLGKGVSLTYAPSWRERAFRSAMNCR